MHSHQLAYAALLLLIACEPNVTAHDAAGVASCAVADPQSGSPQLHPSDPHRFAIDGTTWVPVGYYNGSVSSAPPEWGTGMSAVIAMNHELIDKLADNGVNFYRLWATYDMVADDWGGTQIYPYTRPGPGTASDGSPKLDLDTFDESYFDVLADTVDYARARGIVIQLILFHCGAVEYDGHAYLQQTFFGQDNNIQGIGLASADDYYATSGPIWDRHVAFVDKVVSEIGDRPNLMWEVCNEKATGFSSPPTFDETRFDPFLSAIAAELAAAGSSHLVVGVDIPEHTSTAGHLVPQADQDIDGFHAAAVNQRNSVSVPLISDNDCCSGEADATLVRQKAWAALTAGIHLDMFSEASAYPDILRNANTAAGTRYLGYVRALLANRCIDVAGMQPDDSIVASGNAWALVRPSDEFIVYARFGGSITLSGLPDDREAIWFDPTSGAETPAGSGPTFADPGSNAEGGSDWVLYVRGGDGGGTQCPFASAIVSLDGQVLDIEWASHDDGSRAQIYPPHGGSNQRWQVTGDGSIIVYGDKCLAVLDGNVNGSRVGIASCDGSEAQTWQLGAGGEIQNAGGRCLDVPDAAPGTDLQIYDCNGAGSQLFTICA